MGNQMVSSAGMLFLYLAGEVTDGSVTCIYKTDSYSHPLDFYEQVSALREDVSDKAELELFCVLGVPEKVDAIEAFVEGSMKERTLEIWKEQKMGEMEEKTDKNHALPDWVEAEFERLIQEYIFQEDKMLFPRKCRMEMEGYDMYCLWGGMNSEDDGHLWLEETAAMWTEAEKPFLFGKQMMIQTFELSDLTGRKVIGAIHGFAEEGWYLLIEGGMKLYLNREIPYLRELIGVRDMGLFTVSEIDRITSNPVYAYGRGYQPQELCEEWHKAFLFTAALAEQVWEEASFVPVYEKFLSFLEENISEVWEAKALLEKKMYWSVMIGHIDEIRGYLKGEEEVAVSKDFLLLLNSRYAYLPYLYELMNSMGIKMEEVVANCGLQVFSPEKLRQIIELGENGDSFQKGVQWEAAAEYFISHIKGLKVSGRRINVGVQEIDLSIVNTSLDSNLWEMGAYLLTECKNWADKVGIQVIRGLSYSSNMKGNKTTLLFAANGVTRDGKREILRAAVNQQFILCFTKQELLKVKSGEECYELLIDKWRELKACAEREMMV